MRCLVCGATIKPADKIGQIAHVANGCREARFRGVNATITNK